jgi:hypothetical protein
MLSLNDIVTHPGSALTAEVLETLGSICEHRRPFVVPDAASSASAAASLVVTAG